MSPEQFIKKWRHSTLKERSASQSHFNDLCALLGEHTPTDADPDGTWYTFERGAKKTGGGKRECRQELARYLRQPLSAYRIVSVKFSESYRDSLIQLADMVAGAIAHAYRDDVHQHANR